MSVNIRINSPNVKYTDKHIAAQYSYHTTSVQREGNNVTVRGTIFHFCVSVCIHVSYVQRFFSPRAKQVNPITTEMTFHTERHVPRLGVMLVGWGGNNGSTVTGTVLANKMGLTWRTKTGEKVSEMIQKCL